MTAVIAFFTLENCVWSSLTSVDALWKNVRKFPGTYEKWLAKKNKFVMLVSYAYIRINAVL